MLADRAKHSCSPALPDFPQYFPALQAGLLTTTINRQELSEVAGRTVLSNKVVERCTTGLNGPGQNLFDHPGQLIVSKPGNPIGSSIWPDPGKM
jgi:hypothetical protein